MKAILTKYHGPTNTRGSRISASDSDGNRVFLAVDNSSSVDMTHDDAARALCAKLDWHGRLVRGWGPTGYVYVFDPEAPKMHGTVVAR